MSSAATNPPDGDARFLIKEFIMPRLQAIDEKLERVASCQINLKIVDEQIKGMSAKNELMIAQMQESFLKHVEDVDKHYNSYYSETYFAKMKRKSPEIVTGVSLSSLVMTLLYLLVEYLKAGG